MKSKIFWLVLIVVCLVLTLWLVVAGKKEKKNSEIITAKTEVINMKDGKTVVKIPLAKLPAAEKKKEYETITGKVVLAANNPEAKDSSMRVSVLIGTEMIAVSNSVYVNTLRDFYVNKNVRLSGKWIEDAVIYGKKYRVFWIENVENIKN
jgi:hypothetical protein